MKKLALFLAALVAAALSASAQDWAKAILEKSPRHGEWVNVEHDNRKVNCFITYPEVKDKATAVLVIHEIFGMSDWVRVVTDELAAAGYIAIAPDLLSGLGKDGGGTDALGGADGARKVIGSLPPDQITADLNAVASYVTKLPAANGKLAVVGFCWGGGQCFRFATNNHDIKAACVFYGTPPATPDLAKITAPVYGFYAGNDARIGATVPKTVEDMKAAGKPYEPVTYDGAGHGFMRAGETPGADEANKKAREESWVRLKKLLEKI